MSSKPNYRVRTAILIIVSLIPGLVLSLFQNVDGSIVRQVRSESNPSSRVLGKCRDCNDVFLFWKASRLHQSVNSHGRALQATYPGICQRCYQEGLGAARKKLARPDCGSRSLQGPQSRE